MSNASIKAHDAYLERIKQARSKPAVQKISLSTLRASIPNTAIIVLEGKDDKPVYAQWFRRVRNDFRYEPFVCNGKKQLLSLRRSLENDLGNLRERVYFLVDRDFDDLCDQAAGSDIFMTDRYSIENYLVDAVVLEQILVDYLHCDGDLGVRKGIISLFHKLVSEFCALMKETNLVLFLSKTLQIEFSGSIDKISKVVNVDVDSISLSPRYKEEKLVLLSDPDKTALQESEAIFNKLSPEKHYRGKYLLSFFCRWLQLLGEERVHRNTELFGELYKVNRARTDEISMGLLASISPLPIGFDDFALQMQSS